MLWRGGDPVRISPFQITLLSLAFSWRLSRIPRASMQRLLWDSDEDKLIRHRLSQLVYQVNRVCGARVIALEREHLCVSQGTVPTDLERFDEFIASRTFLGAYELLDRGFLPALASKRTGALSAWIHERRQEQRDKLRALTLDLWEEAEMAHDWLTARRTSEILLRLNPTAETDLQRVMRANAMSGRVREAEATYQAFAERVSASGDWVPAAETAQLLEDVRTAQPVPMNRVDTREDPGAGASLVGRTADLSLLCRRIYRKESTRPWTTIAVVGDEGIGKTRLVHEAMEGAVLRGYRIVTACGAELESEIPLNLLLETLSQPWAEAVLKGLGEPAKATLAPFLPRLQDEGARWRHAQHQPPEMPSRQICEAFLDLFTAVADSCKTILVLDDFHWADDATLTVLQFLARRWKTGDFTLLLVCQAGEARGNKVTRRWPDIQDFDRTASTVRLGRLDADSVQQLVRSVSKEDLVQAEIDRIAELGGGNPRFLVDLAADAPIGIPRHGHPGQVSAPASVHRALSRRLRGLTDGSKRVAYSLAVLAAPATVAQLIRLTETTRDECAHALEELYDHGMLDWSDATVSLRNAIIGAALYERLSPARRALLHARVAEMLHDQPVRGPAGQIALHHFWAGNHDMAHLFATEAARLADRSDGATRLRFLRLAWDASDGARQNLAGLGLARLHQRCRRLEPALLRAEKTLSDPHGLANAEIAELRLIAAEARHRLGHAGTGATLREFADIEDAAAGRRGERVRAAAMDATVQLLDREADREAVLGQAARLAALEPMSDPAARSRASGALSVVAAHGDFDAGVRHARQAVESARDAGTPGEVALALQRLAIVLMIGARIGSSDGWNALTEARQACAEAGETGALALMLLHLADWQITTGDREAANATLSEAADLTGEMDCPEIRTMEATTRGNLAMARGELESAATAHGLAAAIVSGSSEAGFVPPRIPYRTLSAFDALEGTLLLESGKLSPAAEVADRAPLPDSLDDAPMRLILFHARLRSRKGEVPAALDLLANAIAAKEHTRPLPYLVLALEAVRLARRSGRPQPDLAGSAHARATRLGLAQLAHEFLPFFTR